MVQTSASFSFRNHRPYTGSSISLSEVISALSYALDLTEGAVHGHALRSCLLGMRIADAIGLPADQADSLYYALLLKDIACDNTWGDTCGDTCDDTCGNACGDIGGNGADRPANHRLRTRGRKPDGRSLQPTEDLRPPQRPLRAPRSGVAPPAAAGGNRSLGHDRGASILSKLGMGALAVQAVFSLDERWDGSGSPTHARAEQIPLLARICSVAEHLDRLASASNATQAIDILGRSSGSWFDPELVRVATSLDRSGTLWTNCSAGDSQERIRQAVLDLDPGRKQFLRAAEIDRICEAFADVVDARSHFTFRHSLGVADAALGISLGLGLSAERVQLVRRAALLHDIGKLSVSNSILDKAGGLTIREWRTVRQHPRHTRRILERVGPFQEIAVIAGEHHEKLDGSGYPSRLMARHLSLESRIIAVADVYGALSEDRPYRAGLDSDEIIPILEALAPHKLDAGCVEAMVAALSCRRPVAFAPAMQSLPSPMLHAAV